MNIDICKLELQNIDLKPRDSEKIRGYLGNKYIENDILHNHNQDKFIYRYPMVQYKIIDKTAMIIGIGKASNLVANIGIIEDEILIDDKLINIYEKSILRLNQNYGCKDDYIEYKFITPWLALNQNNIKKYTAADLIEKEEILKRVLIGNILSFSKGMDYTVDETIKVKLDLNQIDVKFKQKEMLAFIGEFFINFEIPDNFAIGKGISRGFGTVKKI